MTQDDQHLELDQRAQDCINEARREFDNGRHALAIERLESHTPYDRTVIQAARDFRAEWESIKQKRAHVDDLIHKANREMEGGSFVVAIGLLTEAAAIDPNRNSIQSMIAAAEHAKSRADKAERTRGAWRQELDKIDEKVNSRDFEAARKMVKTLSRKRSNQSELSKLSERIDDVEASLGSLASAQARFDDGDFQSAVTYADRALLLNPDLDEARELKRKALESLPREG